MEMTEKLAMRQEEPDILKQMLDRPGVQNALRRDPGPGPVAYSDSRGSSLAKGMDDGKVSMAAKGPPAYPGPPFLGRPMPRPVVYGPPPQPRLCGTFRPRPMPPPRPLTFVSCMGPPLGLREYTPGILPRRCDLPLHPRVLSCKKLFSEIREVLTGTFNKVLFWGCFGYRGQGLHSELHSQPSH
ncbi:transport and Golgi organization protein 1 homolog isoform X2 [Cavia porcellus]|uniref:transport and Golgi organization protein 1 homolog isoform X2 n=1 Tax=Cavia porcellus TaxID=10141 RepID=UPI002FDF2B02